MQKKWFDYPFSRVPAHSTHRTGIFFVFLSQQFTSALRGTRTVSRFWDNFSIRCQWSLTMELSCASLLPHSTKHQPHGNCEYLPLFLLVYERVMKATKNMRAQCWNMCSVDYKGCFLPISYSSDGAWNCDKGWKRPWKGSQKLKHDSYLFFARLSGSDLTSLPGRVLFANKFLVLHASAMVWYVYLTCSVLWNEKYVPTENKTKK